MCSAASSIGRGKLAPYDAANLCSFFWNSFCAPWPMIWLKNIPKGLHAIIPISRLHHWLFIPNKPCRAEAPQKWYNFPCPRSIRLIGGDECFIDFAYESLPFGFEGLKKLYCYTAILEVHDGLRLIFCGFVSKALFSVWGVAFCGDDLFCIL